MVFLSSFLWQLVIYYTGGIDSYLLPALMLFPGIVAVAFRIITKEGIRKVGWGLRRWWTIIPALILPLLFILVVGWLLTVLNWATVSDRHFLFKDGMVEIQLYPLVLGSQTQSIAFFALNLVLSLFVQSLLGSVVTIGEEFGWRGYAQEKLIRKFGLNRGLILLGAIWGYWHLPISLMGWNFPNHPVLGALILTPISTIFLGIYMGWLYLRSKSVWMPTLAHAAWNLCATLLLNEMIMQRDNLYLQLTLIAAWGMVGVFCLISLNTRKPVLWQNVVAASTFKQRAVS
ncbi:MAG: type II CAAX endopeptidase family protein [Anaerolineales bacterium]